MAATMDRDKEEAAKAFLSHLPELARGPMANLFHHAVRTGAATPAAVLKRVAIDASGATTAPYTGDERRRNLRLLLTALAADPDGARLYAEHCLRWNALPEEERQTLKRERDEAAQRAYMARQPVTEAQRRYLLSLGHDGEPENRLAASDLIGELRTRRTREVTR
jgi:hypothetical protein